jgi:hypothetical protein
MWLLWDLHRHEFSFSRILARILPYVLPSTVPEILGPLVRLHQALYAYYPRLHFKILGDDCADQARQASDAIRKPRFVREGSIPDQLNSQSCEQMEQLEQLLLDRARQKFKELFQLRTEVDEKRLATPSQWKSLKQPVASE